MTSSLVTKISKLLAKAENTDSVEEAATFFEAAQRLCSQHSIDMALAYMEKDKREATDVLEERKLHIGQERSVGLKQKILLWNKVATNNNIRYSIAHNSTMVHPIGFSTDLDAAEALFAVLAEQMVRLGNEFLDRGEWKGEMYFNGFYEERKVDKRVARRSFYEGFISAIGMRLSEARTEVLKERVRQDEARDANLPSVTSLALMDREQAVSEFTVKAFKARGVRGSWSSPRGGSAGGARNAGHNAGRTASMTGRKALS